MGFSSLATNAQGTRRLQNPRIGALGRSFTPFSEVGGGYFQVAGRWFSGGVIQTNLKDFKSSHLKLNSRIITSSAEKPFRNDFFMPCHSAEEQEAPE